MLSWSQKGPTNYAFERSSDSRFDNTVTAAVRAIPHDANGADEAAGSALAGGVEQARQHGVNVVAHALRLDYSGLKKRLNGTSVPPTAFVELMGASGARADEYVIEFESKPSPRMRVQWKGAAPPDWSALLRAWREVAG
jgi:hypothetical protein